MNNSKWQISKVGLIDFWYYDEEEFDFLDGRMLLRGSKWFRKICYHAELYSASFGRKYETGTSGSLWLQGKKNGKLSSGRG